MKTSGVSPGMIISFLFNSSCLFVRLVNRNRGDLTESLRTSVAEFNSVLADSGR